MTGWAAVLTGLGLTAAAVAWAVRWSGPRPDGRAEPGTATSPHRPPPPRPAGTAGRRPTPPPPRSPR